jgi:ribokinase
LVKAAVVGSVNMDLVIETERLPRLGETLSGGRFSTAGGGKGANQAVGAARLGAFVSMVGAVGDDSFGTLMRSALEKEGVDCTRVAVREKEATGVAMITVLPGGENTIIVAPGANGTVKPDEVVNGAEVFEIADVLLAQLELPVETVFEALKRGKNAGTMTVFDPAPYKNLPDEIWEYVDIAVPNRLELEAFTGLGDLEAGARKLLSMGPRTVVTTLGTEGAYALSEDTSFKIPSFKVKSIDSTGAGDAFSAALAVSLAEGLPLAEAVRFASAAGALASTVMGAQPSLPRRAQVESFLSRFPAPCKQDKDNRTIRGEEK